MSEVLPAPVSSADTQSYPPSSNNRRRRRPPSGIAAENANGEGQQPQPSSQQQRRGGNRGGRQGSRRQQPAEHAAATSSTATGQPAAPATDSNPASNPARRNQRGRNRGASGASQGVTQTGQPTEPRQGRQNRNPRGQQQPTSSFGGRQFGGRLTGGAGSAGNNGNAQLDASTPEFRPGEQFVPRPSGPKAPQVPQPRKRRASKSNAPDIATRTHEDIDNGHYECAICTNEVLRNSKVWSCRTCWTVFHLGCIKKWSSNQTSSVARQEPQNGELPPPRQWRCPGCNLPKDTLPSSFTCWCEKEVDPKTLTGLPPFSCGQTCARPHILPKKCPHPCPSTCHAGPCPPCSLMGPTQQCFCGKQSSTKRCVDTNYDKGWSCGQICGARMHCGQHVCERPCHEGPCGTCEVRVDGRCYCGKLEKAILCCDRGDAVKSCRLHLADDGTGAEEEWIGEFECGSICQREFDCGKHRCEQPCHPQDGNPTHCPSSPDIITHCPCGKTKLETLSAVARTSCTDPIPNCRKPCRKLLSCGHECEQLCHSGECLPCLKKVTINCRCGRIASSTICHQGCEEPPHCSRICRITLNCGRHECGERCCSGERKAVERQAAKRRQRPLSSAAPRAEDNFEAEHICTRPCGRLLKCGNHTCQELCHKGPCGSCREAIFDEISCDCGRTVLQPPLPCGTGPPPCRFQCERPKPCGHPQVAHNCHVDEEQCPKCPFLTEKECMCGKQKLKNVQCWLADVSCGQVCGRKLKCGAHKCQKQCHRPGECEDVGKSCQQACGKEKSCGHPCSEVCHSPYACKEDRPCQHKIFITCDCQRIKQEIKCNASRTTDGNRSKVLRCDDECARLERNRKLALALNIDPATHTDDHIPYSSETLKLYMQNPTLAQAFEKQYRILAADTEQKRIRFKPMPSQQRAFLHSLAEDFGFDSESVDPEPHRHVAIFKTPRFVMAPMKTIMECVRIKNAQRPVAAVAPVQADPGKRLKASNLVGEPYNGFLMTNVRFALTIEELRTVVKQIITPQTGLAFDFCFLPTDEVAFRTTSPSIPDRQLEEVLTNIKPTLQAGLKSQSLGHVQLCRLDTSFNILRSELDSVSNGGWSQVAAKAAAPIRVSRQTPIVGSNSFTVLSLSKNKKKAVKPLARRESVADDWEAAEMAEEEKEMAMASGASGDEMHEEKNSSDEVSKRSSLAAGPSGNADAAANSVSEDLDGQPSPNREG